jgi:K+-sensing histidine kinase KdpD
METFAAPLRDCNGEVVAQPTRIYGKMPAQPQHRGPTRSESGGTGLGLSISYGIIDDPKGTIEIDTAEGRGTTVTLSFPTASE